MNLRADSRQDGRGAYRQRSDVRPVGGGGRGNYERRVGLGRSASHRIRRGSLRFRHAAHALAQHLRHAGADHSPTLQATFTDDDPTEYWSPLPLIVDGQTVTFRWLVGWTSWVALGVTNDSVVGVQARNIEPDSVRLVGIDDLEPYLADDGLPR